MSEHSRTITVHAPADVTFGYLSDARHLPDFMPRMRRVEPHDDGTVTVTAVVTPDGTRELEVQGTAWLEVDQEARAMRWGSERHSYRGSLTVEGDVESDVEGDIEGDAESTVEISLSTEHGDPATIDAGLDRALEAIAARIEARA
ncbi:MULTISPECIES: SRPBCC family protein [Arsenicicoccus]|uniref:SRPBCC family protein n=1 Tax=Arsenicicoccus bolidensis TaxID=229480 RepID=A0ABS9PYM2_9MICO|nr:MULTISPECIES: SRPBCC family protein [Arsenicicoccus]MCG7320733.1 SRPBCC family protein [Arsenicicoccus bolidensis]